MSKTPQDVMAAAAYMADKAAPYFATARSAMPIIYTDKVPIMAVDKQWRMYVNPEVILTLPIADVAIIWMGDELGHCLKEHARRCEEIQADRKKWNKAADCENRANVYEELPWPEYALMPSHFKLPDGLLAEDYYSKIPDEDGGGEGNEEGKPGEGKGGKGKPKPGKGNGKPGQGEPTGGSCADGEQRPWELPEDDKNEPGLTPLEQKAKQLEVAAKIQEAVKERGSVPGDWERWAETIIKPVVAWPKQLQHAVCNGLSRAGLGNQTYSRVKKRAGILLPRHHRRTPVVAVVCDTSGSMGSGEGSVMQKAMSEVIGVARHTGSVNVVWTDAECHLQRNVRKAGDIKAKGGGGTDMRVGIKYAAELRNGNRPDIIITVTDGYTPWEMAPPRMPHIAVIVGEGDAPKFGKVIRIPTKS